MSLVKKSQNLLTALSNETVPTSLCTFPLIVLERVKAWPSRYQVQKKNILGVRMGLCCSRQLTAAVLPVYPNAPTYTSGSRGGGHRGHGLPQTPNSRGHTMFWPPPNRPVGLPSQYRIIDDADGWHDGRHYSKKIDENMINNMPGGYILDKMNKLVL